MIRTFVILYRHAVTHIPLQGPKQAIIPGQAEKSHERPYEPEHSGYHADGDCTDRGHNTGLLARRFPVEHPDGPRPTLVRISGTGASGINRGPRCETNETVDTGDRTVRPGGMG